MDPKGPTPPKPRGRVKHQRKRALFSTMSNTPTQLLIARIHELEARITNIEETLTKVVDRINVLSPAVSVVGQNLAVIDQALGWALEQLKHPNFVGAERRTAAGLVLPPGVQFDSTDSAEANSDQGEPPALVISN